ncbi:MAG: GntR family transcriptional regulator [Betaproteobacteria bacterium]|nr:GntR family transcriptional regulator [Betaproteobacteria bacterium]
MASKVIHLPRRAQAPKKKSPDLLQTLRSRIASQEFPPGAKLREQELAEEFGVPRARIRQALFALEQRGLVERIPNRGAVVTRLDLSQVFRIYDVREVLEGLCVRLATQNAPRESWQDLLDEFKGPMRKMLQQGDLDAYTAGYDRFRRRTIEAAANPLLAEMLDSIFEKTQVLIRRILILPGRADTGLREHIAVLEAMRHGDADEAERLRRANLRSARAYLERYQKYVL